LHCTALLVSDDVAVYPPRDSRVAVSQLLLHHGRSNTVGEQGAGDTVTDGMTATARDVKLI